DLAVIVSASQVRRQMVQSMGRVLRRKSDDSLARFAVLYLEVTTEDPAKGAHEAFLGEITELADDIGDFRIRQLEHVLDFLAINDPVRSPRSPRFDGDAPRTPLRRRSADDDVADAQVLGVG